jgi:TRAP-type C4-dicarboxylate transport system substrate-binding protein
LSLGLAMAGPGSTQAQAADVIELRAATYFANTHALCKQWEQFLKTVEKRCNGKVKIKLYAGGTLLKAKEIYDGVVKGVADLGMVMIGYTHGRFPEMELIELPHGYASSVVSSHAANDFYHKFKPKEFNQTHLNYWFVSGPSVSILSKPVRTLAEFKGLKVRGTGRVGDTLKALGAVPQSTVAPEVYTAISRGVIDGIMWPYETLYGWKLADVAKYVTSCWQVGGVYAFYSTMNKKAWDKLPADVKKVFDETSKEWIQKAAMTYLNSDVEGMKHGKKLGVKFIDLSPDQVKKWKDAIKPVIGSYVKQMVDKGYSKADMKARLDYLNQRIAYWSKWQKDQGIKSPTGGGM